MKIPAGMAVGTTYSSNNYGMFKILEYRSAKEVEIQFLKTAFVTTVRSDKVKNGAIKDLYAPHVFGVGYLGRGKHKVYVNGKNTKVYSVWHSMLSRCYSPVTQKNQPTYIGCRVHSNWHCFQTFGDWFDRNYIEGYHLDKDIKFKGCKIYSPETCTFVSRSDNNEQAQAKFYTFLSPSGLVIDIYNMRKFCKDNSLSYQCMSLVNVGKNKSHKGWSKHETR